MTPCGMYTEGETRNRRRRESGGAEEWMGRERESLGEGRGKNLKNEGVG